MPAKIIRDAIPCSWCGEMFLPTKGQAYRTKKGGYAYHSDECREAGKSRTLTRQTLLERFLAHCKRLPNGCLECDYAPDRNGYPTMVVNGKRRPIGHVAYYLHYGEWPPKGMMTDHVCHDPETCAGGKGCPHRRCAEWSHLMLTTAGGTATAKGNNDPSRSACGRLNKARANAMATCKWGHPWTPDNIYVVPSTGVKSCRECRKRLRKEYSIRLKMGKPIKERVPHVDQ